MFCIGICDDEIIHREHIKELCEQYFTEYPQEHEYVEFTSGEEVLKYEETAANSGSKLHLLFLDVEMGEVDGIEVLREVENADWIWRIVFVSSHEEMVWNAFSIKTLEFARKPVEYNQIEKWIEVAIRENMENVILEYVVGTQPSYIVLEDIYYLRASGNYTYLNKKEHSELINGNLKAWQEKIEQTSLVRIHKSYIINMQHVQKWETDVVILSNGSVLAVGRRYAKEAKERYLIFVKKQAVGRMYK